MQDSFDKNIHAVCEEDLIYPDETLEFLSDLEVIEEKKRKYEWRKQIKNI